MHWRVHFFTIIKLELLQKLLGIFGLMNIDSIIALVDLNFKDEFQGRISILPSCSFQTHPTLN